MKKALSLIGMLCLLLAFVIPVFVGPMSVLETPFWDSFPHSTSGNVGGEVHENPVRVAYYTPLESFVVDGTYKLNKIEVHVIMCNYVQEELNSFSSFPDAELRANLYNWTPADGGDYKTPTELNIGTYHYDITDEILTARHIMLTMNVDAGPTLIPDPTVTYSIGFNLLGDGADIYDICIYRSLSDTPSGRGHVWGEGDTAANWIVLSPGEGQDIAMRLYGTEIETPTPDEPGNGNGNGDTGDGDGDEEDVSEKVPWITALLFALGIVLMISSMIYFVPTWFGIFFYLIVFGVSFALWYFWLIWAWLGVFV